MNEDIVLLEGGVYHIYRISDFLFYNIATSDYKLRSGEIAILVEQEAVGVRNNCGVTPFGRCDSEGIPRRLCSS